MSIIVIHTRLLG